MLNYYKTVTPAPAPSPPPTKRTKPNPAAKQGNISAATRTLQYKKGLFHAENEKLFCDACNTVVDHIRKDTIS